MLFENLENGQLFHFLSSLLLTNHKKDLVVSSSLLQEGIGDLCWLFIVEHLLNTGYQT